jgi:hypothetical protein
MEGLSTISTTPTTADDGMIYIYIKKKRITSTGSARAARGDNRRDAETAAQASNRTAFSATILIRDTYRHCFSGAGYVIMDLTQQGEGRGSDEIHL